MNRIVPSGIAGDGSPAVPMPGRIARPELFEAPEQAGRLVGAAWAANATFAQLDELMCRAQEYEARADTPYKRGLIRGALAVAMQVATERVGLAE